MIVATIYGEFVMSIIHQGKTPRRLGQIAGAAVLAAVSGWLALDYLGDAHLPGVAVPVEVLQAAPAGFNSVVAGATTTRASLPPRRSVKARTRRVPANPAVAEASPALAAPAGVGQVEASGQTVGAVQPFVFLPPPVAMLAAACAMQQKLAEGAQVY
jgi:hypothetical protein